MPAPPVKTRPCRLFVSFASFALDLRPICSVGIVALSKKSNTTEERPRAGSRGGAPAALTRFAPGLGCNAGYATGRQDARRTRMARGFALGML